MQRLTYTIIKEETNIHLVLNCQSSALHLRPSPGLSSLGQLSSRQHGRRFLACSYTCGSILLQTQKTGPLGFINMGLTLRSPASWNHRHSLQHLPTFYTLLSVSQIIPATATARADGEGSGKAVNYGQRLEELPCFLVAATNTKGGCDMKAGGGCDVERWHTAAAGSGQGDMHTDMTKTQLDQQKFCKNANSCKKSHVGRGHPCAMTTIKQSASPPSHFLRCLKSSHLSPCKPG